MSIPIFLGRSRMCPFEAMTSYFEPRYFLIVLAFAGDSTTTRVLVIRGLLSGFSCDYGRLGTQWASEEPWRTLYYYVLQGERQERCQNGRGGRLRPGGDFVQVKRDRRGGAEHGRLAVRQGSARGRRGSADAHSEGRQQGIHRVQGPSALLEQ